MKTISIYDITNKEYFGDELLCVDNENNISIFFIINRDKDLEILKIFINHAGKDPDVYYKSIGKNKDIEFEEEKDIPDDVNNLVNNIISKLGGEEILCKYIIGDAYKWYGIPKYEDDGAIVDHTRYCVEMGSLKVFFANLRQKK